MGIEALKEQARGHEQAEEWDKALSLYTQAIERQSEDEHADLGLFNRAGDLSTRLGNLEGALEHYEQAVKLYLESELPNNAIAILKKILRNMPFKTDVFLRMGQIRASQGFLVDARENFLKYAEVMQQEDNLPEALRALTEFAGLAPTDVDVQIMVASQLHAAEKSDEAVRLLVSSYTHLLRDGKSEGREALQTKIHEIDPSAILPSEVPGYDDFETTALADEDTFIEIDTGAGDGAGAGIEIESTQLAEIDTGEDLEIESQDDLELEVGTPGLEIEAAADEAPTEPLGIESSDESWALEIEAEGTEEHRDVEADAPEGFDLEVAIAENDAAALELESEGPDLDAAMLEIDPEPEASEGDLEAATLELESWAALDDEGQSDEPDGADVAVEGADLSESWVTLESDHLPEGEVLSPVDAAADGDPLGDGAEDEPLEAGGLDDAWLSVPDGESLAEPVQEDEVALATAPAPWTDGDLEGADDPLATGDWIGAGPAEDEAPIDDPETWLGLAARFEAEGDREQARTAYVEAHLGFSERLDFQRASLAVASLIALEPNSVDHHRRHVEYLERTGDIDGQVAAHLALGRVLVGAGQAEEAEVEYRRVLELDPANELASSQLKTLDGPEVEGGYIDLGSLVIDRVEKTTRWTVEAEEPTDEADFDFRQMLSQFKEKVAEHVDVGDVRAHYDLGTAYREMGLMNEAISEFQLALRADEKNLATYEMLGQCFLEKGEANFAVRSLGKAANLPHDVEDELLGIYYYLGRAHEELGQRDEAVEFYEKVFALDINFQDVTERLRSLR